MPNDDPNKPVSTLTDDVEEFEEKQHDYQAMYNVGGHFKEQLEALAGSWHEKNKAVERKIDHVEEIPEQPDVESEAEGYIEKVEKDPELMKRLADDYVQTVGMQSANPQNPKVTLPLSDDQIQQGLHHQVWEAIRWLAEWCLRQLKLKT